jgi:hypothetical protein
MAIELKSADLVPDTEELSTGRDHSRDDFQKQVDGEVSTLIKLWHEQGDQEAGKGAPTKRYVVGTDDRAEMRKVIERAFTLASRELNPKIGPSWYQTKVNNGTVALKFAPKYLPVKATPDANANGNATPPAEPPAEPQAEPQAEGRRGFGRR